MNSPDFTALQTELHQVEARIRTDFHERNLVWLDLASKAMRLISRMIVEASQPREPRGAGRYALTSEATLVAGLEPRAIDVEEFRANTPEKFELVQGYLFDTAEHPDSRRRLLALLLVNVGLLEAVRLAPQERWLEALARGS